MAFLFIRANDPGIDRHVVGNQNEAAYVLLQAKILWSMPAIQRIRLRFHALAI